MQGWAILPLGIGFGGPAACNNELGVLLIVLHNIALSTPHQILKTLTCTVVENVGVVSTAI
jgi:hypothetical protein